MNRFNKSEHKYYLDNDILLLSVTRFISQYAPEFNASLVAHMVSKSNGRDKDDILNEWDLKREIASDYGNSIHKAIELWVKFGEMPKQEHLEKAVLEFVGLCEEEGQTGGQSEYQIFDEKYELGGTIDYLTDTKIIDFKTNDTEKKGKGRFKEPLKDLKHNNLNKARLQLSIYDQLTGGNRKLEVWNWDGDTFTIIPLKKVDVSEILKERLAQIM